VTIQGAAAVGSTLQATADVTGTPAPTVSYQWAHCGQAKPDKSNACSDLAGTAANPKDATAATYTIVGGDVGSQLIVQVTAKNSAGTDTATSAPTALVPDPAPPPKPSPPPKPPPSNPPPSNPAPAPVVTPAPAPLVAPVAPSPARPVSPYLSPFPVVRVQGASVAGGAIIRMLQVTAPRRAKVNVGCVGAGCPVRHLSLRTGRIRPLERFLPAGLAITIRVTRAGYIGKYVRFIVRSHAAPERHDACLLPGSNRPRRCPA
jgi:hypothetical protein